METLAGFRKTGRVTRGPASDLVELSDDDGFRHTAIAFHPQYRDHPAIGPALEVVKGFLEDPYVTGLVELVAHEPEEGAFVYPTGECWSIYEVIRKLADLGATAGVRAGLELLYAAGQILIEAAETGESHAVYSHGGLTPWRVMVKADGQVQIIGHAVPQVEILQFHKDPEEIPKEDAFRYCPPERMEADEEDLTSDLFSLALIAFELMTGRPVYDGLVNDIRTQAARGEGSRRLFRFKDVLPAGALDLLRTCLKPEPEHRHEDAEAFLEGVQRVLASREATGPALMEIMDRMGEMRRPPGEGLEAGKTMAVDKDALRRMVADLEEGDAEPEPSAPRRESFKPAAKPAARRPRRARRAREDEPPAEDLTPPAAVEPEQPSASPDTSADRWKPPARGRRTRQPRRSGDEPKEDPKAAKPRARPVKARAKPGADDILQALKSSADSPGRRKRSRSTEGDAAKLLESILTSSGDARRSTREAEPTPRDQPKPDPPAEEADDLLASQVRERPRARRRSVRRRAAPETPPDETPAEVPETPSVVPEIQLSDQDPAPRTPRRARPADRKRKAPEPTPAEEAPKARRRRRAPPKTEGLTLEEAQRPAPEPEKPEKPEPEPAPTPEEPAPKKTAERKAAPKRARRKSIPVERPTPREAKQAAPQPDKARKKPAEAAPRKAQARPASQPADSIRAPKRLKATGGSTVSVKLRIGAKGESFKTRFPGKASLAESVARLSASLLPVQADLAGRLSHGWRLGPESGPAQGDTLVERFGEGSLLVLHPVLASERLASFEVQSGDTPIRFRAPVSNVVPVATLVDHLVRWLELPEAKWRLWVDKTPLDPYLLLDEVDLDTSTLTLKS